MRGNDGENDVVHPSVHDDSTMQARKPVHAAVLSPLTKASGSALLGAFAREDNCHGERHPEQTAWEDREKRELLRFHLVQSAPNISPSLCTIPFPPPTVPLLISNPHLTLVLALTSS